MAKLSGKVAVVTGGGRGIGEAIVRSLAHAGATVVVSARTVVEIEQVANDLCAQGKKAYAIPCDVSKCDDIGRLFDSIREEAGWVDILVNNAGIAASTPIGKLELAEWNRLFLVNVTGTFLCTQAALPGMIKKEWGRVINIASVAGFSGSKYISAYSASKHAVVGFTRCVAAEMADKGVTVNSVCPGFVATDIVDSAIEKVMGLTSKSREEAMKAILRTSNQSRLINPVEVAHAVLSLCDDNAGSINGQALVVDCGGLLA